MPKLSVFLFISLFIFSCSNEPSLKIIQGEIYGTTWQLKYSSDEDEVPIKAIVISELNRIDKLFSHYKDDSLTSLINKNKIAYKDVAEEWKHCLHDLCPEQALQDHLYGYPKKFLTDQ